MMSGKWDFDCGQLVLITASPDVEALCTCGFSLDRAISAFDPGKVAPHGNVSDADRPNRRKENILTRDESARLNEAVVHLFSERRKVKP